MRGLRGTAGVVEGACPAPELARWAPDFTECGAALAGGCPGDARHGAFACPKWITKREAALAAAAQLASPRHCPAPTARSARNGAAGFLWGVGARPLPRGALSTHYCELPLP